MGPGGPDHATGLTSAQTAYGQVLAGAATSDGSGFAVAQVGPFAIAGGFLVYVTRALISCTPTSTTLNEFKMYATNMPLSQVTATNLPPAGQMCDHSYSGDADVADENNPIPVNPGQYILGVWAGSSPGAVCTLTIIFNILTPGF